LNELGPEKVLDWDYMKAGMRAWSPGFLKTYIDLLP
jgi:hypothetical protein